MAQVPLPPEPEQILPPRPMPPRLKLLWAGLVGIALIALVWVLRALFQPPHVNNDLAATLPALGSAQAPLTIYEFASFGCDHCARLKPLVQNLLTRYEGRVRIVYVPFPRGAEPTASRSAMAGVCAAEQGKFWEFADKMYAGQADWMKDARPEAHWVRYAAEVGINTNRFLQCLESEATREKVSRQVMLGAAQMISQTPTFLIGHSRLVAPQSEEDFVRVIERELKALPGGLR